MKLTFYTFILFLLSIINSQLDETQILDCNLEESPCNNQGICTDQGLCYCNDSFYGINCEKQTSDFEYKDGQVQGGGIAGMVVGILIGLFLLYMGVVFVIYYRKRQKILSEKKRLSQIQMNQNQESQQIINSEQNQQQQNQQQQQQQSSNLNISNSNDQTVQQVLIQPQSQQNFPQYRQNQENLPSQQSQHSQRKSILKPSRQSQQSNSSQSQLSQQQEEQNNLIGDGFLIGGGNSSQRKSSARKSSAVRSRQSSKQSQGGYQLDNIFEEGSQNPPRRRQSTRKSILSNSSQKFNIDSDQKIEIFTNDDQIYILRCQPKEQRIIVQNQDNLILKELYLYGKNYLVSNTFSCEVQESQINSITKNIETFYTQCQKQQEQEHPFIFKKITDINQILDYNHQLKSKALEDLEIQNKQIKQLLPIKQQPGLQIAGISAQQMFENMSAEFKPQNYLVQNLIQQQIEDQN